jgi:hypothetical protein
MTPAFIVTNIRDDDALSVLAYQHSTERVTIHFTWDQAVSGYITDIMYPAEFSPDSDIERMGLLAGHEGAIYAGDIKQIDFA